MVTSAERYQGARGLEERTPGGLVRDMLVQQPSIRLAGQLSSTETSIFITSPIQPTFSTNRLNNDLNVLSGEIPDSKVTYYTVPPTSFSFEENDPRRPLRLGGIEATVYSETGATHGIEVFHYPHPWLADLMLVFRKILQRDSGKLHLEASRDFAELLWSVRPMDLDEDHIGRLRRTIPEIKHPQPRRAWRVPCT